MTRHRNVALAALLLVAALVGGLVVVVRAQSVDGSAGRPAISAPADDVTPPSGTPTSDGTLTSARALPRPSPTPTIPKPTPPTPNSSVRAPAGTIHIDDRYRARYHGTYASWGEILDTGKSLPKVSAGCRADWRSATRDAALNWDKAGYLCLDRLPGQGFKPQGIGGSGTSKGYRIGGRPAAERNIVVVSSYSSGEHQGLAFPNDPGRTDSTRLTVIDLDQRRYNTVELVKPAGADRLTALDSHGSGLAWAGQYLYSSSRTALWLYNADDLMRIDGRYVLPAVARWSVQGPGGGLSSLGIDRSGKRSRLISVNYTETGSAWSQTFELDETGLLRGGSTTAEQGLTLTRSYGTGPATVRSTRSSPVPGTNYQGVGTSGPYRLLNSSSLMLAGRRHGDHLVIMKRGTMIARFSMPSENVESLYVDYRRGRYVTVTEHGRRFLFWLPLNHVIDRAERPV